MNVKATVSEKLLNKYADLSLQIKDLEAQRAAIKPELVESFVSQGVEKVESDLGTFSVIRTSTWTYSKKLTKEMEDLKIKQVREQEKGTAKAKVNESIRFQAKKED